MQGIRDQIEALNNMSPAALRAKWREVHRSPAPNLSPSLLARGIAYRLQERVHGGLSRSTEKQIANIARRLTRTGSVDDPHAINLKPGTRLVRSWNGTIYKVLVGESGFEFDGRQYKSLSQIARDITGAHWSGPRFFGVKPRSATQSRGKASG